MPCHDDRESPAAQTSTIKGLQARNDELAQLLCSLCRAFTDFARTGTERPGPIPWPPKVLEWWAKHEAQDRARLDALRKQYRDKVKEMDDEELSILHQVISSATAERQNPRPRS